MPVKPMIAALGSALHRLRCSVRVCERWVIHGAPSRATGLQGRCGRCQHYLEAVEPRRHAHLTHEEDHAQALPGTQGVPGDAAALVAGGALSASAAFLQAGDRPVYGADLLVARHHLAGLAIHLPKDHKVADEVEQVGGSQHAGDEDLLAVQRAARAAQRCRTLFRRAEEERRAGALGLLGPPSVASS